MTLVLMDAHWRVVQYDTKRLADAAIVNSRKRGVVISH